MNRLVSQLLLLAVVFSVFSASSNAFADASELIKRAVVRADWTSSCQNRGANSVGTEFSLHMGGFGYVITYQFETDNCSGAPKFTTRTAVKFVTATSEDVVGAADFGLEPVVVHDGEPLAYNYSVTNNGNATLTFTLKKTVVFENGKQVVKKIDPELSGASSIYYPINRGPTLRSYLHDRILHFDRFRMDSVVNAVRSRGGFTNLNGPSPLITSPSFAAFTPNAAAFLSGMNKFVFGNDKFLQPAVGGNSGRIELNGQTNTVFIDGAFGTFWQLSGVDAQLQTEIGIAHAVATYVYQFYLEKIASDGKSIYGQASLADAIAPLPDSPTRDQIIDAALTRAMQNAEIDALSVSLFGQLGTDTSKIADAFRAQLDMVQKKFFYGTVDEELELNFITDSELGALVEIYAHELALREELAKF